MNRVSVNLTGAQYGVCRKALQATASQACGPVREIVIGEVLK